MNRTEFDAAYREARVALKVMATFLPSDRYRGRLVTREERKAAEDRWIAGANDPQKAPAFKAYGDSLHLPGSIANAALFDYRFCGGHRRDWYLRMARESRERAS